MQNNFAASKSESHNFQLIPCALFICTSSYLFSEKAFLTSSKQVGNVEVFDEMRWMWVGKEKWKVKRKATNYCWCACKMRHSVGVASLFVVSPQSSLNISLKK